MIVVIKSRGGPSVITHQTGALGIEHAASCAIREVFQCSSHLVPTSQDESGMRAENGLFFDIVKNKNGLTLLQDH